MQQPKCVSRYRLKIWDGPRKWIQFRSKLQHLSIKAICYSNERFWRQLSTLSMISDEWQLMSGVWDTLTCTSPSGVWDTLMCTSPSESLTWTGTVTKHGCCNNMLNYCRNLNPSQEKRKRLKYSSILLSTYQICVHRTEVGTTEGKRTR